MMRIQAFLVVAIGIVAAGSWATDQESPKDMIPPSDHPIERRIRDRAEFLTKLEAWLADWEKGALTLREVSTNIKDHCEVFYTHYLESLSYAEEGKTVEVRIAQNLVRHYENRPSASRNDPLVARVHNEFREQFGRE